MSQRLFSCDFIAVQQHMKEQIVHRQHVQHARVGLPDGGI
jgi:hypothetical protein